MHRRCCLLVTILVYYTASCKHSLVLLRMGEIIARNILRWLKLLIKLLLLRIVGCLYYCISDGRSHTHQIFCSYFCCLCTELARFVSGSKAHLCFPMTECPQKENKTLYTTGLFDRLHSRLFLLTLTGCMPVLISWLICEFDGLCALGTLMILESSWEEKLWSS